MGKSLALLVALVFTFVTGCLDSTIDPEPLDKEVQFGPVGQDPRLNLSEAEFAMSAYEWRVWVKTYCKLAGKYLFHHDCLGMHDAWVDDRDLSDEIPDTALHGLWGNDNWTSKEDAPLEFDWSEVSLPSSGIVVICAHDSDTTPCNPKY